MRVLFVCSGNICRSPMAAEYFRSRAAGSGMSHLVTESSGLLGIEGAPASPESISVLRDAGFDLSSHRSRGFTQADARAADWIVVMTSQHAREIERRFPVRSGRLVLLRAFDDGAAPAASAPDLDDPIQRPISFYRDCFGIIRNAADNLLRHLRDQPS